MSPSFIRVVIARDASRTPLGHMAGGAQQDSPVESEQERTDADRERLARSARHVRRLARALGLSSVDAEDAAQDALLRAHERLTLFHHRSALTTWLFVVVRNVVLDGTRRRCSHARAVESLSAHALSDGALAPCAEELLLSAEAARSIQEALEVLPEHARHAIVSFALEGRSYDEIAMEKGVSVGTVKSRIARARQALRRTLTPPT